MHIPNKNIITGCEQQNKNESDEFHHSIDEWLDDIEDWLNKQDQDQAVEEGRVVSLDGILVDREDHPAYAEAQEDDKDCLNKLDQAAEEEERVEEERDDEPDSLRTLGLSEKDFR